MENNTGCFINQVNGDEYKVTKYKERRRKMCKYLFITTFRFKFIANLLPTVLI